MYELWFKILSWLVCDFVKVFEVVTKAKAQGFDDVVFLDAAAGKNIEEVSSCNIFIVKVK